VLLFLASHKRALLGIPLIAALVAAVISILMQTYYAAVTKILPPQQGQSSAAVLGTSSWARAVEMPRKRANTNTITAAKRLPAV
jgi:hypothetical protein